MPEGAENRPIKLGRLEMAVRVRSADGREAVTVSTPSMWALADEFADGLRRRGVHTEAWVMRKFVAAVQMQAAQAEGLFRPGAPLTLDALAEFMNECEVSDAQSELAGDDGGDAKDPSKAARGKGRERR